MQKVSEKVNDRFHDRSTRENAMARERKGSVISRGSDVYARIRFVDDAGKRVSKERKAANKTDAKKILREWLRELDTNGPKQIIADRATFAEVAETYKLRKLIKAEYRKSGSTQTKIAGLRSFRSPLLFLITLNEFFGNMRIASITHAKIEDYKLSRLHTDTRQGTTRAISGVNRELTLLRAILNYATRERFITSSPFTAGDPLISRADENKRDRVLSPQEESRLLAVCEGETKSEYVRKGKTIEATLKCRRGILRVIIITALDTAMRRGELLTLKWSDVDFLKRQINILAFNTKTAQGRPVPMTGRVHHELRMLYEKSRKHPDDLVFGITNNFNKSYANARSDAEIEGLTFHDLRHTATTRMVQAGIPTAEIMKITGHTQMSTFMRYLNPDAAAGARFASRLDEFNAQHRAFEADIIADVAVN